jgi:RNA polymerase sigma-70 factor (ECF subfamily)
LIKKPYLGIKPRFLLSDVFMATIVLEDSQLIAGIRGGGIARERAASQLYDQCLRFVFRIIKDKGLSEEEARDAYVDAVVAVVEQVAQGKFRGDSRLSTYLFQILTFKSIDLIRRKTARRVETTPELPEELADPAQSALERLGLSQEVDQLSDVMGRLGGKCRDILLDWAYHGYSMEEIAQRHDLKGATSAATQKYKCFKRLQTLL